MTGPDPHACTGAYNSSQAQPPSFQSSLFIEWASRTLGVSEGVWNPSPYPHSQVTQPDPLLHSRRHAFDSLNGWEGGGICHGLAGRMERNHSNSGGDLDCDHARSRR